MGEGSGQWPVVSGQLRKLLSRFYRRSKRGETIGKRHCDCNRQRSDRFPVLCHNHFARVMESSIVPDLGEKRANRLRALGEIQRRLRDAKSVITIDVEGCEHEERSFIEFHEIVKVQPLFRSIDFEVAGHLLFTWTPEMLVEYQMIFEGIGEDVQRNVAGLTRVKKCDLAEDIDREPRNASAGTSALLRISIRLGLLA